MSKKYKLLIDSPEYPKGTIAQQINENGIVYQLSMFGVECASELYAIHIENRPTVWELIPEEPEKKIVESTMKAKIGDVVVVRGIYFECIGRKEDGKFTVKKEFKLGLVQKVVEKAWYEEEKKEWVYGDGQHEFTDSDICENLTKPLTDPALTRF